MNYFVSIYLLCSKKIITPHILLFSCGTGREWRCRPLYKLQRRSQPCLLVGALLLRQPWQQPPLTGFSRAPAASWSEPWLVLLTYGNKYFHESFTSLGSPEPVQETIRYIAYLGSPHSASRPSKGAVSPSHLFWVLVVKFVAKTGICSCSRLIFVEPLDKWGRWYCRQTNQDHVCLLNL